MNPYDPNTDDKSFDPGTLKEVAAMVEKLRTDLLFSIDGAGADPYAEQHYLLGIGALETAYRNFNLASYFQAKAIRESTR